MPFLPNMTSNETLTLFISTLGLMGGIISTLITLSAKRYEDQRQLRTLIGDFTQKLVALRSEDDLLQLKILRGQGHIEEINLARSSNIRSQKTLARMMVDALESFKRPASPIEYEVLGYALTTVGEKSGDRYWRLAAERTRDPTEAVSLLSLFAFSLFRAGRVADGEDVFREAFAKATGEPMHEGYVHQIRGQALHALRNLDDARTAFDRADASYAKITSPGLRDYHRANNTSARKTLEL